MNNLAMGILQGVYSYMKALDNEVIELREENWDLDSELCSNGCRPQNHWESVINQWSKCLNY